MNAQRANRLIHETSPYLLQHAHNPVDWYAWGPEALDKAHTENRPILLSIGYSACHWCHVMERESFENEQIAALMNAHFVNIKVDREERPDLDHIYQTAVQLFTGQGGWPLTMFLTPDQEPFYGGTYFPPDDRYGRPGFPRLLRTLADAYHNRQQDVVKSTTQIREAMQKLSGFAASGGDLSFDLVTNGVRTLASHVDMVHGGFGTQPKFPNPTNLDCLLRYWHYSGNENFLNVVKLSLDKMAGGGIYDQLGGGFHRYSVDDHWLVPHFEKMLYDNALLTRLPELEIVLGPQSKSGLHMVQKLLQEAIAARAAADVPKATSKIGTAMDTLSQLADGLDPQEAALMRMLSAQFRQALTMGDMSETQRVSDVMRKRSGATIKKKP